jgi:hypothetical protein
LGLLGAVALATVLAGGPAGTASAVDPVAPRIDHDTDTAPANARLAANARTITVNPATGPDFELPFVCGQVWNGSSRSGHSPSYYTIDFNRVPDRGQPALASAAGVVTKVVTLTGSYGRYVVIDHGGGWSTLYAHLDGFTTSVGATVDQGEQIGIVGGSGGVTGPHLHFEERKDGAYFAPYFHRTTFRISSDIASQNCNDRPVTGDWNGDGTTDVGVVRTGTSTLTFHQRSSDGTSTAQAWGIPGDLPALADYDGDHVTQLGVRRRQSSTWYLRSASGAMATVNAVGGVADLPLTGDWDGNGRAGLGYYRPSNSTFYLRADDGSVSSVYYGATGDRPVVGDWNGDGRTDVGIWRNGNFWLRVPNATGGVTNQVTYYGQPGDVPLAGDWDGDGRDDVAVWRPGTAQFWLRDPRAPYTSFTWGAPRG